MPNPSVTKPGTKRLSEVARHIVMPADRSLSGWADVRAQCRALGISFETWQDGIGRIAFAKRPDGVYSASVGGVCMSIPRQVGKTFLVGAIAFAVCLITPNTKVIWTAHHSNTADETFEAMSAMAKMRKVAPHVRTVRSANGQQRIVFKNGSRIEFGARERGFGRGKQKVSLLVLDEAQHMSESALENIVPSMNRAVNPLMFMMGTPPRPEDKGEMFANKRRRALDGESTNTAYIELGADPDAKLDDRKQWAKANPSYPHFTPEEAMLRMRESFGEGGFRREALGIWDADAGSSAISAEHWSDTGVDSRPDGTSAYSVAFSMSGERLSLAGAVIRDDDTAHVELIDKGDMAGLAALADWFCAKDSDGVPRWRKSSGITLGGAAGAGVLKTMLIKRRVPDRRIRVVNTPQYLQACTMYGDEIEQKTVTHLASEGQAALDASVGLIDKDKRGGWTAHGDGDETPVEAVSLALWGARTGKRKSTDRPEGKRKAVIV